jgi:hypothetical protein
MSCRKLKIYFSIGLLIFSMLAFKAFAQKSNSNLYAKTNLTAWCIVPFDNQNRSPEQRAAMLKEIGINKLAYDWREKHIPEFDREIAALRKNNIKLQAFWFAAGPDPSDDAHLKTVLSTLKRNRIKTELWCMFAPVPEMDDMTQEDKVKAMSVPVAYVAKQLAEIGCTLGLYNHGGWFGEPENQLAIINYLKMKNIGMVYNFSHSETQIQRFNSFYPKILPHLLSINLTGLRDTYPAEVVPIGQGNLELGLMRTIQNSNYRGPIGIINEDFAPDAREGLLLNMQGIVQLLKQLDDREALKSYQ